MAVTAVPGPYQWAEMQRIALGRGMFLAKAAQPPEYAFVARAFIGFPWPMNIAGMRAFIDLFLNYPRRL
jgi:hypothetical protein